MNMDHKIEGLGKAQRDRLAYIDLRLRYTGEVMRQDIVESYDIKSAAATRDFALYKELAPKNLSYDKSEKRYIIGKWFSPLFEFFPQQILPWIAGGYGDTVPLKNKAVIPNETTGINRTISGDVLAIISRGIYSKRIVEISYRSLSSGLTVRSIAPFVLVANGDRWHVRAHDRKNKDYRDFSLSRIIDAKQTEEAITPSESYANDIQWNRIVELDLVPHPANIQHPDTIEAEYGMQNGVLRTKIRAALVGYFLRRWNIDCTADHSLKGKEYQLWLKNSQALYGVENLILVPGHTSDRKAK
ncbi:MAG: WYL domain-containing protein [Proteobacteria bacterium]|nr:WYL domain-containing protein [Pseudomonadota bacterium]